MRNAHNTSRKSGLQRVLVGSAIGLVILLVLVIVAIRVLRQGNPRERPLDVPVENPVASPPGESQTITLAFVGLDGTSLVEEQRTIFLGGDVLKRIQQVLEELIQGSAGELTCSIPEGTGLKGVFLDTRGVAYLDFSSILASGHPGGTTAERLTVEAIVRTVLTNFPEHIRMVQIMVDGSEIETLAGHVDLSRPLTVAETPE